MKPVRIQRKRTKGWRMPKNTIYVGRGSKWGNPYKIGSLVEVSSNTPVKRIELTSLIAVTSMFEQFIGYQEMIESPLWKSIKKELKGKNLCCWCKLSEPCHADVLLKIANKES